MKDKALEYCIEVYEQYTREEINNFHGSIIRCWKTGKRAMLFTESLKNAAAQIKMDQAKRSVPFFKKKNKKFNAVNPI